MKSSLLIPEISLKMSHLSKEDIDRERVIRDLPHLRRIISYWRVYPDKFVDYLVSLDPRCKFKFHTYQRMFLRCVMRYQYVYATYPRAYSKSFLSIMALMLRAILYPGTKLFVVSGGKGRNC